MRLALTVLLVTAGLARVAHAGWECMTDQEGSIRAVETYAKNPKADVPDWLCLDDPTIAHKVAKRIDVACAKILDRKDASSDSCIDLAAFAGLTQVGSHDIFALVAAREENPFDFPGGFWWPRLPFLAQMGEARGAAIIRKDWDEASPKAAKKRSSNAVTSWVMWRRDACGALATIGGRDDLAFLEQQLATTTGSRPEVVKNSCSAAIAEIKRRLGQP